MHFQLMMSTCIASNSCSNINYYDNLEILFLKQILGMITDTHDPITDAVASIQLFKKYYVDPAALLQAQQKLLWTRPPMSWRKRNNWQWEGVCMAAFMPSKCHCGAPTFRKD